MHDSLPKNVTYAGYRPTLADGRRRTNQAGLLALETSASWDCPARKTIHGYQSCYKGPVAVRLRPRSTTRTFASRASLQMPQKARKTSLAQWSGLLGGIDAVRDSSVVNENSQETENGSDLHLPQEGSPNADIFRSPNDTANNANNENARGQQLTMLNKIKYLEWRLKKARRELKASLDEHEPLTLQNATSHKRYMVSDNASHLIKLTKEDYVNMVDLYYYLPQKDSISSPTNSPTPLLFKESPHEDLLRRHDFADQSSMLLESELDKAVDPDFYAKTVSEMEDIQARFRDRSLGSNSLLEPFIDLLLQKEPPPRRLFRLYQRFPQPGVAYLPSAAIRLFLHRMSTHSDKRSEANMVRYLSIIEDMQAANIPITVSEWSSAIYLAGRAFWQVTDNDLNRSMEMWKQMEQDAGVRASNVTFNILFDISVKAKKYVFADRVLKEMFNRKLYLNRLGRVSFIWYQGWLGDGDAVRRAYRDFVDAGEIVDTLVLNCVMVSLMRAQEPIAAEQIYERMKALQADVRKYLFIAQKQRSEKRKEGNPPTVTQYPPPGSGMLDNTYASNSLGRILLRAAHLSQKAPEIHQKLQASMPMVPNSITFRILIDHYAVTSGEMDRLSVILNDMTDFGVCLNALHFRLIFKGFYVHGGSRYSNWTAKLLKVAWQACLTGMKSPRHRKSRIPKSKQKEQEVAEEVEDEEDDEDEDESGVEWTDMDGPHERSASESREQASSLRNLSQEEKAKQSDHPWRDFIREFTGVNDARPTYYQPSSFRTPEQASTRTSSSDSESQASGPMFPKDSASSPFFTSQAFSEPSHLQSQTSSTSSRRSMEFSAENDEAKDSDPSSFLSLPGFLDSSQEDISSGHIKPSLALVKWVLRAHTKVFGRREMIEDVWWECKRVWKPKTESHKQNILATLAACLDECDRRS